LSRAKSRFITTLPVVTTIFSKVPVCPVEIFPDDTGAEFVEEFPRSRSSEIVKQPDIFFSRGITLELPLLREEKKLDLFKDMRSRLAGPEVDFRQFPGKKEERIGERERRSYRKL
jgi:hypothetical protein